jgi:hypothetical protein
MSAVQELSDLAKRLTSAAAGGEIERVAIPLKALDEATRLLWLLGLDTNRGGEQPSPRGLPAIGSNQL